MDLFSLAGAGFLAPLIVGGTAWLWHLGTKVAALDARLEGIIERLRRIEALLDSLVQLGR